MSLLYFFFHIFCRLHLYSLYHHHTIIPRVYIFINEHGYSGLQNLLASISLKIKSRLVVLEQP